MPTNDDANAKSSALLCAAYGVVREPPCRNPDHAGDDVGFRVGERVRGADRRCWRRRGDAGSADDRVGDPRDVPDP